MGTANISYQRLVENAPVGVYQVDDDDEYLYTNETLARMLGFETSEQFESANGEVEHIDPAAREAFYQELEAEGHVDEFEVELLTRSGDSITVLLSGTRKGDVVTGYVVDITEQSFLERKTDEQAAAIRQLSTPIVQIWDGVLLATVVGTLDTERAQQLTEDLLVEITESESEVALVDITGVPSVDTATAQHLIDTVNAVALLGSEVIITGINPDIAQTLVHLGITMSDIETRSSLSEGLRHALGLLNEDLPSRPQLEE